VSSHSHYLMPIKCRLSIKKTARKRRFVDACYQAIYMSRTGIEPVTHSLKGCCSAN
jgi:hypothetical protein